MKNYHICSDYIAKEGYVFIEVDMSWDVLLFDRIKNHRVIECNLCSRPAKRLDHHYPCHTEHNRCWEHDV